MKLRTLVLLLALPATAAEYPVLHTGNVPASLVTQAQLGASTAPLVETNDTRALDFSGAASVKVPTPTATDDAVTKNYVDSLGGSVFVTNAVDRVAFGATTNTGISALSFLPQPGVEDAGVVGGVQTIKINSHMAEYTVVSTNASGNITIAATNGLAQTITLTGAATNVYSVASNQINSVTVHYIGVDTHALDFGAAVWRGDEPAYTNANLSVDIIMDGPSGVTEVRRRDEWDDE